MAYCRTSDPENTLYVTAGRDGFNCYNCSLLMNIDKDAFRARMDTPTRTFTCKTKQEMLEHMLDHEEQGDEVSTAAIYRLEMEIARDELKEKTKLIDLSTTMYYPKKILLLLNRFVVSRKKKHLSYLIHQFLELKCIRDGHSFNEHHPYVTKMRAHILEVEKRDGKTLDEIIADLKIKYNRMGS